MRILISLIVVVTMMHARERIKLTTYAKKYIGRRTSAGERYMGGFTAATNKMKYYLHEIRIWKNGRYADVRINDTFNRAKFALPFVKLDLSAEAMKRLGLKGWAWADSIEVLK
jgi:rare lipoprotein A (peptidoglycan hydrolase)